VPCERVFSSASETDTKRCNRINSDLFEALQVLKFGYKRERLNFSEGLLVIEEEMLVEPPPVSDIDNLGGLVTQTGETLDAMLAAISIDNDN
jgi:hypothetical protein